jgi:hypothetical protein
MPRPQHINIIGQTFDRLLVRELLPDGKVLCECRCGRQTIKRRRHVVSGQIRSCGCLRSELMRSLVTRHGEAETLTPEYRAWCAMRQRCSQLANREYARRGITVCERWKIYENFLADVGRKPSPSHTLDRFPNNGGNYEPGNVRWATSRQQNTNKRTSRIITAFGKSMALSEWEDFVGARSGAIWARLNRGVAPEVALALSRSEVC